MQMLTTENSGFFLTAVFQTFLLGEASRETTLVQNLWGHSSLLIQGSSVLQWEPCSHESEE